MPWTILYSTPALRETDSVALLERVRATVSERAVAVDSEHCYYVDSEAPLTPAERERLEWLLRHSAPVVAASTLAPAPPGAAIVEVGPRLSFSTAWCTNAVAVANGCGLGSIRRIERSRRYRIQLEVATEADVVALSAAALATFHALVHDRMTEMIYPTPLQSFDAATAFGADTDGADDEAPAAAPAAAPVRVVRVLEDGSKALEELSEELGLGFDEWDLAFYTELFAEKLKRNPTDVECFDMAQSNSEHSRHWFFGGRMVIDGEEKADTLFQLVKQTLKRGVSGTPGSGDGDGDGASAARADSGPAGGRANANSVIAFHDNSSAIRGAVVRTLVPKLEPTGTSADSSPDAASDGQSDRGPIAGSAPVPLVEVTRTRHPILTAETHNFPSGVAPFPGAETGTGGRLRDVQATGTGALVGAGISAYCVGNLLIPGYSDVHCPWELPPAETKGEVGATDDSERFAYPGNLATPLQIIIDASDGASDYGNKFGEPVITGFARSFGQRLPRSQAEGNGSGERREWLKPIMFSAGIGHLDDAHTVKGVPEPGMWVVKVGGPAYRIGMGGGAASSRVQGGNDDAKGVSLDFDAVQRGDAEMENKMNRVVRGCVESLERNPIVSIHDQGAGGNGNVLKEISEPAGARLDMRQLPIADNSMSALELWGAEYQENNALLLRGGEGKDSDAQRFLDLCARERCPAALLGKITGDGNILFVDSDQGGLTANSADFDSEEKRAQALPVELPLELVLGDMPQKTFTDSTPAALQLKPLALPLPKKKVEQKSKTAAIPDGGSPANQALRGAVDAVADAKAAMQDLAAAAAPRGDSKTAAAKALVGNPLFDEDAGRTTVARCLDRVLRLMSVGSKRFLTTKVDRSVSGLIAQQQCVGPLHTPLADVAVVAQSHLPPPSGTNPTGIASAVGEQPIKGLLSPAAMARITVGEALTNLMWAPITELGDVKCSVNWMWASKLPGELSRMYEACKALRDVMLELGVAVDGGKDSLSMAAKAPRSDGGDDEVVKAPGTIVVTCYALCTDVRKTITPDLKCVSATTADADARGVLIFVDLGEGKCRLGGSALAQVHGQLGDTVPDVDDPQRLATAFGVVQSLIAEGLVLSGHDRSDGGLLTTLLEMAFAGNCGLEVNIGVNLGAQGGATSPTDRGCPLTRAVLATLFNEELGLVLEVHPANATRVAAAFSATGLDSMTHVIGHSTSGRRAQVSVGGVIVVDEDVDDLRDTWEATSFALDRRQANATCVEQEVASLRGRSPAGPSWKVKFKPSPTSDSLLMSPKKPRVAVLRQEGSNGDREMGAAFHAAGFEAWDIAMADLVPPEGGGAAAVTSLDGFHGIAFVGGFSFADVLGSARGWAATCIFDERVQAMFEAFRSREDTFSLGVCNGCQLMALLGWVADVDADGGAITDHKKLPERIAFRTNLSGRFESRFSTITIENSPACECMLRGMDGSTFGVWVAHGEGRAAFTDDHQQEAIVSAGLAPMRYVDDNGTVAGPDEYPYNPNGSPAGIAALCSFDGRHLAMMPHPERCFLPWQWPWMPAKWRTGMDTAPWLRLFQNARTFVSKVTGGEESDD